MSLRCILFFNVWQLLRFFTKHLNAVLSGRMRSHLLIVSFVKNQKTIKIKVRKYLEYIQLKEKIYRTLNMYILVANVLYIWSKYNLYDIHQGNLFRIHVFFEISRKFWDQLYEHPCSNLDSSTDVLSLSAVMCITGPEGSIDKLLICKTRKASRISVLATCNILSQFFLILN